MLDKKNLLFFAVSWCVTFALINYFFPTKKPVIEEIHEGTILKIEEEKKALTKPLSRIIPPIEIIENTNRFISISTKDGELVFDIQTGSPCKYTYNNNTFSKNSITLFDYTNSSNTQTPELFLLIDDRPWYNFSLIKREENDTSAELLFKENNNNNSVMKKFVINKNTGTVDCDFYIETEKNSSCTMISSLHNFDDQTTELFIMNRNNKINKINNDDIINIVAAKPRISGLYNSFFINTIIQNTSEKSFLRTYFSADNDCKHIFFETKDDTNKHHCSFTWYAGAKTYRHITHIDARLGEIMEYGWFGWLSAFLLSCLEILYKYINNIGLAIIIVALLIRLLFLPLSLMTKNSVHKRNEFQKKYKYIQDKYKDDTERRTFEQTELIKQYGIIPGGAGCLPVLLQIPLMIALQRLLRGALFLYKAPFFLWMQDISLVDYYYFLPFITTVFIYLQATRNSKQTKAVSSFGFLILSVAMFFVFSKISIGLLLFISSGIIFSYLQMIILGV
jgi:YidC/Oxa1 family membrane protein insertase